jgi:hypothetical protein
MNQDENIQNIKETFNVSSENREIIPAKSYSKVKLIIAIISTILILAATTTLLIGYFKFDWFKKEIYKVDANITREVNQANFFTENKKVSTKIALTPENYEEQDYEVNTDFMVYLKDKTELAENDNLYRASIVILKSKMTTKDEEYELPSFNISDESKVKEFKANPDGSKFPIADFSFYENGTISDVKFLKSTDEYNSQTLNDLIEKVIPKISRNRTEDYNNGLNIKTRTDRKKKTLIEEEKPKQYHNFKGSKFSKSVERDFEDDKLTDIRTKSDIHLQSTPEEGEEIFGASDFYFKSESNIISYERTAYSWDLGDGVYASLTVKGASFTNLPPSIVYGRPQKNEGGLTPIPPGGHNHHSKFGRNLGYSISADKTFNIGKYNVLGQSVTVKYHVAVKNGKPINEIIISSNLGTTTIGNTGVSLSGSWSKTITVFKFAFPAFPLISLNAKAKGSISWSVSASGSGKSVKLSSSLSGKITLGCELKAGVDFIASLSAGVEGVIVNASGSATIQNGSVTKNFSISAGKIYVYLDRSFIGFKKRLAEKTLFNGW